jgi:hypothetical protein
MKVEQLASTRAISAVTIALPVIDRPGHPKPYRYQKKNPLDTKIEVAFGKLSETEGKKGSHTLIVPPATARSASFGTI